MTSKAASSCPTHSGGPEFGTRTNVCRIQERRDSTLANFESGHKYNKNKRVANTKDAPCKKLILYLRGKKTFLFLLRQYGPRPQELVDTSSMHSYRKIPVNTTVIFLQIVFGPPTCVVLVDNCDPYLNEFVGESDGISV